MSLLTRFWLQRMHALANASPRTYYMFVWGLVFVGCAYLLLFPALVLAAPGYLVYITIQTSPVLWQPLDWLLAAGLIAMTTIAAWISAAIYRTEVDLPAGKLLDPESFPVLTDRVHELCCTYNAPGIDHIKLTTHFRTELIRTPVSGFPTSYINTLLVGMPVMSCISPLHLKLLLARQIGHLAKTKNRRSRRIIYLRNIWNDYANHYSKSWKPETLLLRFFFSWYAPLFRTCTIPAVRHDIFVKDKCMLEITTPENSADAIATFCVIKSYLKSSFWPKLNASAFRSPKPEYLPYQTMESQVTEKLDTRTIKQLREIEINREPAPNSEIPNLFKRLSAIGHENFITPTPGSESATHHFLGDEALGIQKQLDNIWYLQNKTIWNSRYKKGIEEKKRLKILREQAAQSLLSNKEAKEYLLLIEKYVSPEMALPLYQEIVNTNVMDSDVSYELGRLLLASGDPTGVDALQISMGLSKERTPDCCHHIVEFMVKTGDVKEAQHYRRMILEHQVAT